MAEWDNTNERLSLRRGGDRIWQAINLYHLGKVDRLLISGANGYLGEDKLDEANQFKEILVQNGIPDSVILVESISKNTHENAVESKKVLDGHPEISSVLLITSALHMPRAEACFAKAGFDSFDTFTTDHDTGDERSYKLDQIIIPNVSTLVCWRQLIKEWIGYTIHAMMGYL
jgi:uncharacterized SAM-binding protein YcdF (DUF218 family)